MTKSSFKFHKCLDMNKEDCVIITGMYVVSELCAHFAGAKGVGFFVVVAHVEGDTSVIFCASAIDDMATVAVIVGGAEYGTLDGGVVVVVVVVCAGC